MAFGARPHIFGALKRASLYRRWPPASSARHLSSSRLLRRYAMWIPAGLLVGSLATQRVMAAFLPPVPEPGSVEDATILARVASEANELELVKTLRAEVLRSETRRPIVQPPDAAEQMSAQQRQELEEAEAWQEAKRWRELPVARNSSNETRRTLMEKTLATARGMSVQCAFWNPTRKELVAVVWIGHGACGWPAITHGGAIATLFDEAFSRVVVGPDAPLGKLPRLRGSPPD